MPRPTTLVSRKSSCVLIRCRTPFKIRSSPSKRELYHPEGGRSEFREIRSRASRIWSQETSLCPAELHMRSNLWDFLRTFLRDRGCARPNSERNQTSSSLCL